MLDPADPRAPKYWIYEQGGKLRPAMQRYLEGHLAQPGDTALIRAYLQQWIDSPVWDNPDTVAELAELRRDVRGIATRMHLDLWLEAAFNLGIDPL